MKKEILKNKILIPVQGFVAPLYCFLRRFKDAYVFIQFYLILEENWTTKSFKKLENIQSPKLTVKNPEQH